MTPDYRPPHRDRTSFDDMTALDWFGLAMIGAGMVVLWRCS